MTDPIDNDMDSIDGAIARVVKKTRLLVDRANPDITVARLRDILVAAGDLYDRGTPVRLYRDPMHGGTRAQVLRSDDLVLHAHSKCRPYAIKTTREGEREVDVALPRPIGEMYIGWSGARHLPPLNGITRAPLLRDDGSIHATVGYDAPTGLWCEDVPDVAALVPERPTRADAEASLQLLRETFSTFCYGDAVVFRDARGVEVVDICSPPGADESAFLVSLLTAVCRASLSLAPGCVIRAAAMSGAGVGKGLLARCICQVAFGQEPHAVSGGSGQEELEKRIAAELIEASPVLFLDNLNSRMLRSDLLASFLTEPLARVRLLGRSQMMPLNSSAFVVLTGNGLALAEDLVRRFLVIELDPRTEDPEKRSFKIDIQAHCRDHRLMLLAAALTIWRWGRQADDLQPGHPLGSFEVWGRWVRDPLVALGCQDPAARIAETKARDTQRAEIAELFILWRTHHGDDAVAQKDLAEAVVNALDPLGRGRQFRAKRLESLTGTRMAGYVLVRQAAAGKHGVAVYALKNSGEAEGHRGHRGHPTSQGPDDPDDPDAIAAPRRQNAPNAPAPLRDPARSLDARVAHQDSHAPETHRGHRGHTTPQQPQPDAPDDPDADHDRAVRACSGARVDDTTELTQKWRGRL